MPLKKDVITAPYDFADYILTADDAKATITIAFEDGDPAMITKMLGAVARSKGMGALAEETGLTRASLYKSLAEDGNPLFTTVVKVVDAFGLEIAVRPRRLGAKRPTKSAAGFDAYVLAKTRARSKTTSSKGFVAAVAEKTDAGETPPPKAVRKSRTLAKPRAASPKQRDRSKAGA